MKITQRLIIHGCAVCSVTFHRFLRRMSRLVIWESTDLLAFLHPSPWTPGVTVVTHKSRVGSGSVFHLPEDTCVSLLLGARAVANLLCSRLSVERCALVHTPLRGANAELYVVPLHGLDTHWKPHLAPEEEFHTYDPGFISSKSGPRWSDADLEAIRIRIQPNPNSTPDFTFLGDASDAGLFPRIIRGEEKQWRVWEDDGHVAFLTPFPNTPGLTVLVPRKPLTSDVFRLEEADFRRLVLAARGVSSQLEAGLGTWGVGLIFEGFEIDYAHAKLVPLVCAPDGVEPRRDSQDPPFFQRYPGFVTSLSGPPASRGRLEHMWATITQRQSSQ